MQAVYYAGRPGNDAGPIASRGVKTPAGTTLRFGVFDVTPRFRSQILPVACGHLWYAKSFRIPQVTTSDRKDLGPESPVPVPWLPGPLCRWRHGNAAKPGMVSLGKDTKPESGPSWCLDAPGRGGGRRLWPSWAGPRISEKHSRKLVFSSSLPDSTTNEAAKKAGLGTPTGAPLLKARFARLF